MCVTIDFLWHFLTPAHVLRLIHEIFFPSVNWFLSFSTIISCTQTFCGTQAKPDLSMPSAWGFVTPPRSTRPDPKNCSIDIFHLQLCVVMGNHDIYIRTTPIWSLAWREFPTQTIAQNRSQDQKCLLPEGATESILSIFIFCTKWCSLSLVLYLSFYVSLSLSHQ